ncbi:hypothetical protein FXO38_04793 [Capsicum annuum]|uniref:Uncharacterized protein n=1 Tax=Capsicum annuum TaxID=4072 RepID=A0A2G2ZWT1_CAPAN|nr:hypothetical protein FXO37_19068 [Capsicum annuum]KAF3675347.1 hypothetical protein FXO38_04793 [Capsicum annuum]PHT86447.1 hypothetical protein T459_08553 [Capsicum annuum]
MLLEIICCRSNMDVNVSTEDEIFLPTWVHKCFVENDLKKLVGDEEVDVKSLERMVKIGLLCIHDNPDLCPSMRNVVLMVEGTMDVPFLALYGLLEENGRWSDGKVESLMAKLGRSKMGSSGKAIKSCPACCPINIMALYFLLVLCIFGSARAQSKPPNTIGLGSSLLPTGQPTA